MAAEVRIHLPMQETQETGFDPWVGRIPLEKGVVLYISPMELIDQILKS